MHLRPCTAIRGERRALDHVYVPTLLTIPLAVMLVALLGGCSSGNTSASAGSTPSPLACDPKATAKADQAVTLGTAGQAPASPLRYLPQPGHNQHGTVSQTVTLQVTENGTPANSAVDAAVPFSVTVRKVCDQVFTMDTVYEAPRVTASGQGADAAKQRLGLLSGLIVREARDTRGHVITTSRSAPDAGNPAAQQAVDQILGQLAQSSSVFPEQPVGIGATWTSQRPQTVSGLNLGSRADYTLLRRTDREATLAVRVTITAAPQTATVDGRKVTLEQYRGTGSGQLTVDLTGVSATTGQISLTLHQRMRVDGRVTEHTVSQKVSFSPRE